MMCILCLRRRATRKHEKMNLCEGCFRKVMGLPDIPLVERWRESVKSVDWAKKWKERLF